MIDRLISGADRGSLQGLVESNDGQLDPVEHDLFYPMALGKIGNLPNAALLSRSIVIQMHPATPTEAKHLLNGATGHADANIRPLLRKVMPQHASDLAVAKPAIPGKLINRGADKWRPLLAVAEAAGGDWPQRALAAALELEGDEDERPAHVTLLCKVVAITKDWPCDVIFSGELDDAVRRRGVAVTLGTFNAKKRANLLRLVGLKPSQITRNDKQLRGYYIPDIRSAAEKYIRPDTCDA
jgi:hypothetical protein